MVESSIRRTLNEAGFKLCFAIEMAGKFNVVARTSSTFFPLLFSARGNSIPFSSNHSEEQDRLEGNIYAVRDAPVVPSRGT